MRNMRKISCLTGCLILMLLTTCKEKNGITNNNLLAPVITQISPDSGRFGTEVTITGTNFGATSEENTVTFNGLEAKVVSAVETELVAEVPKGAETGTIEVTVAGQTTVGSEFIYLLTVTVSTWAGSGVRGYKDGSAQTAQFKGPRDLSITPGGTLLIADVNNSVIRRISPLRDVTTFTGSGEPGFVDQTGAGKETEVQFNEPSGVALSSKGDLYVADRENHAIRRITPPGGTQIFSVKTIAGNGTRGDVDGMGGDARFNDPMDVAVDEAGNIYVADYTNDKIKKIDPSGMVTTLAGSGTSGFLDGPGAAAQFNDPAGIAIGPDGILFVSDSYNNRIRAVDPVTGEVSTVAGSETFGFSDGPANQAQFNGPSDLAITADGTIYVADIGNNRIRKITKDRNVTTLTGGSEAGYKDGMGEVALFNQPIGIAVDTAGNLFVSEWANDRIRKITIE